MSMVRQMCKLSDAQQNDYDMYEACLQDTVFQIKASTAIGLSPKEQRVYWNPVAVRKLMLSELHPLFQFIEGDMLSSELGDWRADSAVPNEVVRSMVRMWLERDDCMDLAQLPNNPKALLDFVLRDSPQLQALFRNLNEQVVSRQEKAPVWVMYPAAQVLVTRLLQMCNIHAKMLHSDLSMKDRANLQEEFNDSKADSVQVEVLNYSVMTDVLNLHEACPNCHVLDTDFTEQAKTQKIGRAYRYGPEHIVTVIEYVLANMSSFNKLEGTMRSALPNIVAELDAEMFRQDFETDSVPENIAEGRGSTSKGLCLKGLCILDDALERRPDARAANLPKLDPLSVVYSVMKARRC